MIYVDTCITCNTLNRRVISMVLRLSYNHSDGEEGTKVNSA